MLQSQEILEAALQLPQEQREILTIPADEVFACLEQGFGGK
jgi:hypothetical protein